MTKWLARGRRHWPWLVGPALLLLWEASCRLLQVPEFVLPAPSAIARAGAAVAPAEWLGHTWATLEVALLGFALSCAISLPLALAMVRWRPLERAL